VTYSYNPVSAWTARQQMIINGKTDGSSMDDLNACAKSASMKCGRAATIVAQVIEIVSRWHERRGCRG
jgi:serine/threonine-protein kinase HipA